MEGGLQIRRPPVAASCCAPVRRNADRHSPRTARTRRVVTVGDRRRLDAKPCGASRRVRAAGSAALRASGARPAVPCAIRESVRAPRARTRRRPRASRRVRNLHGRSVTCPASFRPRSAPVGTALAGRGTGDPRRPSVPGHVGPSSRPANGQHPRGDDDPPAARRRARTIAAALADDALRLDTCRNRHRGPDDERPVDRAGGAPAPVLQIPTARVQWHSAQYKVGNGGESDFIRLLRAALLLQPA